MSAYTSGPWKVDDVSPTRAIPMKNELSIYRSEGTELVDIARVRFDRGVAPARDEAQANATLIKASPDLLEAAIEALEHFDKYTGGLVLDCKDALRMVIAKAKGRATP